MNELTDEMFKELCNELVDTKKRISNLLSNKEKQIESVQIELTNTYSEIETLKNKIINISEENDKIKQTLLSVELERSEKLNKNDSELAQPITTEKMIYGIPNLEKRKDESIFDSINHFNKHCPYCENSLYEGHIRSKIEIDHFFPISKGGQDLPWNVLPICKNCNRKKRDKMPYDFLETEKYHLCYEYLANVKKKYSNSIDMDLSNLEIIKNIIIESEHNLKKFKSIEPLREIVNVFFPEYFVNNQNPIEAESEYNSIQIITDYFTIISQKTTDRFFQFQEKNQEVRINLPHAFNQYSQLEKNKEKRYKENQIKTILLKITPGLVSKSTVLTIKNASTRCVIYDYNLMTDEWKEVFNILKMTS